MLNHWVEELREKKGHKMSGWEAQSAAGKSTVTLAPTHTVPTLLQGCRPQGPSPSRRPKVWSSSQPGRPSERPTL